VHGGGGGGGGATSGSSVPGYNPASGGGGGGGGGAGSWGGNATGANGIRGRDGEENDGARGRPGNLKPNSYASTKFPLANRQGTKTNVMNPAMYGKPGIAGTDGFTNPLSPGNVANPTTYNDIIINPFTSYDVTVPDGGYITIKWYAQ
jgi:hypothetical protein